MQRLANTKDKTVYADITLDEDNRFIASKIGTLSEFEKGFAEGFSGKKMGDTLLFLVVTEMIRIVKGAVFRTHIGNAIKDCLDGGDAEVCSLGDCWTRIKLLDST